MNPDQDKNLLQTAKTIADYLAYASNYVATLRGLQHYSRECPAVLDRIGHFITTIYVAIWIALLLKLRYCSDTQKKVLLQERLVICYKGSDAVGPRSLETCHE